MDDSNNYKLKYYRLVHRLRMLSGRLKTFHCPLARQCCSACNKIKQITEEKKDEFLDEGLRW